MPTPATIYEESILEHFEKVPDWPGGDIRLVLLGVELVSRPEGGDADLKLREHDLKTTVRAVPFGTGFALPVDRLDEEGVGIRTVESPVPGVELEIGTRDRSPACVAVRADPRTAINQTTLRKLGAIEQKVDETVRFSALRIWRRRSNGELVASSAVIPTSVEEVFRDFDQRSTEWLQPVKQRRSLARRRLNDDHLRAVADVYREARALGLPTRQAIQERFHVAFGTAGRWVSLARERGLLGEAPGPRQGGEKAETPQTRRKRR